ncbi:MAG: hypothetical protein AB7S26_07630 [Sandaracinaceae bacterium]
MSVLIKYLEVGSSSWQDLSVPLDEYFDLTEQEPFNIDSVPELMEAADYVTDYTGLDLDRISRTRLVIRDDETGDHLTVSSTYWDKGRSSLVEVTDSRNGYSEIILDLLTSESPRINHIVRYGTLGEDRQVHFHSKITTNPDGSQEDLSVYSQRGGTLEG